MNCISRAQGGAAHLAPVGQMDNTVTVRDTTKSRLNTISIPLMILGAWLILFFLVSCQLPHSVTPRSPIPKPNGSDAEGEQKSPQPELRAVGNGHSQVKGEKLHFVSELLGKKEMVYGYLSLPQATDKPVPAMVLVHSSGGLGEREARYVIEFNKMGIATFALDCFAPRGVRSTSDDQSRVSNSAMVSDAFGALKLLSKDPKIDKNRIGIIGMSKGGAVAVETALKQVRRALKLPDNLRFATHVPLYPGCSLQYRTPVTTGAPILMLLGGRDDYIGVEKILQYADAMKKTDANITVIVYPNAKHAFDGKDSQEHYRIANAQNFSKCLTYVEEDGKWVYAETGKVLDRRKTNEFLSKNCITRGASIGTDLAAKKKSLEDIQEFLKESLLKE